MTYLLAYGILLYMAFRKATNQDVQGTCLQGSVTAKYCDLIRTFGEPHVLPDYEQKCAVEWRLVFPDETVATIYSCKTIHVPDGVYDWHVGGHCADAVEHIAHALGDRCYSGRFDLVLK